MAKDYKVVQGIRFAKSVDTEAIFNAGDDQKADQELVAELQIMAKLATRPTSTNIFAASF